MGAGKLLSGIKDFAQQSLSAFNDQMGMAENTPRSLDTPDPNDPSRMVAYGALGDFASKIDQSAQRSYVESGYIRNVKPRHFETLMQEPDLTIVVKKRLFSSLIDNYRVDLMDSADKNFIRSAKRLFQNKCQVISVYERLTKLERIIQSKGVMDDYMVPLLSSGLEALDAFGFKVYDTKTKAIIDQIRKLQAFSEPELYTTWMVDPNVPSDFGEGTGVIELTLVASINTNVSTKFGGGSASMNVEDPYHMMNITNLDIDKAIADVYNPTKNSFMFQFSEEELAKQNNRLMQDLNNDRRSRNAPPIIVKTSDDSILYRRVRAFIDEEGRELIFTFNPGVLGIGASVDLDPSGREGANGLNSSDEHLFETIIKNTYLILNLRRSKAKELNDVESEENREEIQYVREKMRLQFMNKNIIQVMDTVHVFMSSKMQTDSKIIGIDQNSITAPGSNLLSMLNSAVGNLEHSVDDLRGFFGGSKKNSFVEIEKAAIVGPEFPTWLWVSMRNDFTRQAAGVHTFAGLVTDVTESYNSGKYQLSVKMNDNTEYFKQGQINMKPAADVREREIYDPLTPFKMEFDASIGFVNGETPALLPENERLLLSGSVKSKNGSRFLGSPLTKNLYVVGDTNRQDAESPNNLQRVFFDPDGFVYRWKSGIGTYTFSGPTHPPNVVREQTSPSLTRTPFAGQDVMNVMSLLITGTPYNYNTFITAAIKSSNLAVENTGTPNSNNVDNIDVAVSFYRNFVSDLQINNLAWGNFIPFKKLIINERGLKFLLEGQFSISRASNKISHKLQERARLFDSITAVASGFAATPDIFGKGFSGDLDGISLAQVRANDPTSVTENPEVGAAVAQIREIDNELVAQQAELQRALGQSNTNDGSFRIWQDDFSYDPAYSDIGDETGEENRATQRAELRRKLKYLTQRRLWKVKSNEDQNLFIVDDSYDKDYDIQAFEKKLAGRMDKFKSEYSDPFSQISSLAGVLGLEVFADTQGHIQTRPPGYNKMPSSVFYRMVADRNRLYPKQLEALFVNQAEGLMDRLEIIEDELRLRATALGKEGDAQITKFLSGPAVAGGNFEFIFLTSSEGKFGGQAYNIRALVQQTQPDARESIEKLPLKKLTSKIAGQSRRSGLFNHTAQFKAIFAREIYEQATTTAFQQYEIIANRLKLKKGMKVPAINELFSNTRAGSRTQSDVLKVVREISQLMTERQGLTKKLANAFRNLDQGIILNKDPKAGKTALFPFLNKKTEIPSIIEHMIEDEDEDDLGTGSGGRYIIKESQIVSWNISEKPPEFTTIEVNGLFGEGFQDSPASLNFGRGGNAVVSAIGVDYDLWRMYGFKVGQAKPTKFISDPEAQAAPIATWMLNEQRRKIISGTCTIAGNEFMQAGEVVYIESRDLLFYVEGVAHSFSWGETFTTTLTLTYGHNPGEYFPTMLDIIGKGLYSKRHKGNLVKHIRNGSADGSQHLGVLIIDGLSLSSFLSSQFDPLAQLVEGKYGDQNRKVLTRMLSTLAGAETGLNKESNVEIRQYHNGKKGTIANSNLTAVAEETISWLKTPSKRRFGPESTGESVGTSFVAQGVQAVSDFVSGSQPDPVPEGLKIENVDSRVKIVSVDENDPRSPSGQAWQMARETLMGIPTPDGVEEDLTSQANGRPEGERKRGPARANANVIPLIPEEKALFTSILDIWVTFTKKPTVLEMAQAGAQAGQAANEAAAAVSAASARASEATTQANRQGIAPGEFGEDPFGGGSL